MKNLFYIFLIVTSIDSLAIQTQSQNKTYIVKSGDGWYSIARKFDISYPELRLENNDKDDKLFPGLELKIPEKKLKPSDPFYKKKKIAESQTEVSLSENPKFHIVSKSETLFSIAKMYGITVNQLKEWNDLKNNTIHPGQKLVVAKDAVKSENVIPDQHVKSKIVPKVPEEKEVVNPSHQNVESKKPEQTIEKQIENPPATETTSINPSSEEKVVFANGRVEVNEKGSATFFDEEETGDDKYYAHHRTAPVGTVIKVLNISNLSTIFVKVTGQLSDSKENEGLIIKISKAAAQKLGVTGKNFEVNLLYGVSKK